MKLARLWGWSVVLSSVLLGSLAWSQQQTIEELERRFNEKIAAKTKKEAAQRQARKKSDRPVETRQAQEPVARPTERFVLTDGGTIRDSTTGLEWSQSDNGSDIDWEDATRYCDNKGGNWRLPASSELQGIYDVSLSIPCGTSTCRTSPKFRLTEWGFWSNERASSSEAFDVTLYSGGRGADHVGDRDSRRSGFGCAASLSMVLGYLVIW